MITERPDLSKIPPDVRAYIEALEAEVQQLQSRESPAKARNPETDEIISSEPPTTINIVTLSAGNLIKRTPRHNFLRQRRGGMGVFDIDLPVDDSPARLCAIDESQKLLLITNLARAYHLPLDKLPEQPVRSRGQSLADRLELQPGEKVVALLPNLNQGYLILLSHNGYVRRLRHQVFGEYMKPGQVLFDTREFGQLITVCESKGNDDIFIATYHGIAIRFEERLIPPQGCRGIRLQDDDIPVAICSVNEQAVVFILGKDGRGTNRSMAGFSPNKSPGSGGKLAIKSDALAGALTVDLTQDLFVISELGKIIRFPVSDVPVKDGVVQGVNCMTLRADDCVALVAS